MSPGGFLVTVGSCDTPQLLTAVWGGRSSHSTPWVTGACASHPKSSKCQRQGSTVENPWGIPGSPLPLDAVSGSKGCLSLLARPGLQGVPKTKWGLGKQTKEGKENILERRQRALRVSGEAQGCVCAHVNGGCSEQPL